MKLVFFVKSKCPICDGVHTEMEHKDTIEKIKKQNLSAKESAKEIAMDHGEEVDKKNPKNGVKKYYKALKKMEKKLKKSTSKNKVKGKKKLGIVMHEWGKGTLHQGKTKKMVPKGKKGQKQALAIAFSEAGMSKKSLDEKEMMASLIKSGFSEKDANEILMKATHKYIKRTGTKRKFKYFYKDSKGKLVEGKKPKNGKQEEKKGIDGKLSHNNKEVAVVDYKTNDNVKIRYKDSGEEKIIPLKELVDKRGEDLKEKIKSKIKIMYKGVIIDGKEFVKRDGAYVYIKGDDNNIYKMGSYYYDSFKPQKYAVIANSKY